MSGNILLIDSTGSELFVALIDGSAQTADGRVLEQRTCAEQRAHDRNLNKLTADLIDKADAFAVVVGPGSWTGSRVGVVAVKAYALATSKPIIALQAKSDRAALIAEAKSKFAAKQFTSIRDIQPLYDSEFKITPKSLDKK